MKHFKVTDKKDKLIAENLKHECQICLRNCNSIGGIIDVCPIYGGQRRQGKVENNKSKTFLCCDTTKTTKLFREKLEALSYAYPDLVIPKLEIEEKTKQAEQKKVNRLVHNLSSIVGHNIQEIYDIVPQDVLALNWKNQLDFIEKEIKTNPKKAAMMFLRLAKNSIHMKSEFSIYRKLDREEEGNLELRTFPLRTVLLNVLHTFFVDFSNTSVYVNVNDFYGKVKIDYETIQVAIYHLIENATKYVRHNSNIEISFEENHNEIKVHFDMISTFVEASERTLVFNEGVSGIMAKKMKKNGDGIGMWRIKQMMELNGGDFTAIFGDKKETIMGYDFADNRFTLKFKKH
jgi:hypothetical protein